MPALPKRILLKVSGEMLKGDESNSISREVLYRLSDSIVELIEHKIEVGIVLGGGNLFRGNQHEELGICSTSADYMGMLATLINGIALQEALRTRKIEAHLVSGLACPTIAPEISILKVKEFIANNQVVIFVGGTGYPFFTTDTAAALRAAEIEAELIVKATKVPGVFAQDPKKNPTAHRYEQITYTKVLEEQLNVMDPTAIALAMSVKIPIFVFQLWEKPTILEALQDLPSGSIVSFK